MDSLVFVGTVSAYLYSVYTLVTFFLLETSPHLYFESTVFILTFISLGKYLENMTKGKTTEAIKKLFQLKAKKAIVIKI